MAAAAAAAGLRPPGPSPVRCRAALRGGVLGPPEVALLEGLAALGFHCGELSRWAATEALPRPGSPPGSRSHYRRAVAGALQGCLGDYRAAVLTLEREARGLLGQNAVLPLSALSAELGEYGALLPRLHALVWRVSEGGGEAGGGLRGGALLGLLHEGSHSGVPAERGSVRRLFLAAHGVFLRQLAGWMAHGLLLDTCGEFFVQARVRAAAGTKPGALWGSEVEVEGGCGGGEASGGGAEEWHEAFHVDRALLPPYVREEVAAAALFVGKAVRVLRRPFRSSSREAAGAHPGAAGMAPAGASDAGVWSPEDAARITGALAHLHGGSTFDRLAFERAILHVQGLLAQRLWESLMERALLPRHLQALKDYFLLARGDFFHALLLETAELFAADPKPATAGSDLEAAMGRAALKSNAEGDGYFPLVSPRLRALDGAGESPVRTHQGHRIHLPAYDSWDGVSLVYCVDWPLGLLLTPEVLAQYNCLFQYLFRLRRVQFDLDTAWAGLRTAAKTSGAGATVSDVGGGFAAAWRLRHDMSHLVNNLLIYIQVDVIEAQHRRLEQGVAAAKDFQETETLHRAYLSALVAQCFLDIPTVSGMLQSVMQLCKRLQLLVAGPALEPGAVEALSAEFLRKSNTLYTVLKSDRLAGGDRAPYLRQFLLRLNFNDFVDTSVKRSLQAARKLTRTPPPVVE